MQYAATAVVKKQNAREKIEITLESFIFRKTGAQFLPEMQRRRRVDRLTVSRRGFSTVSVHCKAKCGYLYIVRYAAYVFVYLLQSYKPHEPTW